MKLTNTILLILGCLSVPSVIFAQNFSLTASYLYVDTESNGLLNTVESATGLPVGDDLDEAPGFSIEWRTLPIDGISFGLEYIYINTEAAFNFNAGAQDAIDVNNLLGTTFQGGATTIGEEYTAHSYLFNFAYDVEVGSRLNAYVAAGLGLGYINLDVRLSNPGLSGSFDDSDTVFAYQFKAGLRYALNEAWSVQGGIRFLDYQDFDFSYRGVGVTTDADATAYEFGLSYAY